MNALKPIQNALSSVMPLPKTYKAVVLEKVGAPWELKEVALDDPKEGEIVVKVQACGVCFSDVATQQGEMGPLAKFPLIPGHEVVGKVVAIGPGEKVWKVGDRAGGGWHGGHDGTCNSCRKGIYQICENELINGVSKNGGYGEYATLRSEAAVKIPDNVDAAEYAPLLCAGVTVFNGMRKMNVTPGNIVAIQGLGGLGHLALQYSRKMGYKTVALSTSDSKKDLAIKLGANEYINTSKVNAAEALQKMGGAALIVITAPNPKIMGPLLNGCAPLGKVLILSPVGDVPVNTVTMIMRGVSVHGWPSGHALDSEEAISFAETHGVNCMVEKFPLDKVSDAVEHMSSGKVRFRSVLTME